MDGPKRRRRRNGRLTRRATGERPLLARSRGRSLATQRLCGEATDLGDLHRTSDDAPPALRTRSSLGSGAGVQRCSSSAHDHLGPSSGRERSAPRCGPIARALDLGRAGRTQPRRHTMAGWCQRQGPPSGSGFLVVGEHALSLFRPVMVRVSMKSERKQLTRAAGLSPTGRQRLPIAPAGPRHEQLRAGAVGMDAPERCPDVVGV